MKLSANGKRIGRPTKFNQKTVDRICDGLIAGNSLVQVCANDQTLPDRKTVCKWMMRDEAFASIIARARDEQADLMDDEVLDTARKVARGELDPKAGQVVIAALQWRAGKLKAKKYGERVALTGENGGPVTFAVKSILDEAPALPEQRSTRLLEEPELLES